MTSKPLLVRIGRVAGALVGGNKTKGNSPGSACTITGAQTPT
eukprot:CAMPEP_0172464644 /NCGR_PEP_ID=MMETSP1065-20121228/51067_1 /TAXON_ID=265537 /ORGANISM="Amphiprora paludosa, Strain CCMP125" /LENGTH=41 /DNA_ID= /DNA_START= /DNA_END= /DNA_ORIENTATION=